MKKVSREQIIDLISEKALEHIDIDAVAKSLSRKIAAETEKVVIADFRDLLVDVIFDIDLSEIGYLVQEAVANTLSEKLGVPRKGKAKK